jgi:hypothetical protein
MKRLNLLFSTILSLSVLLGTVQYAMAQEGTISISPLINELSITHGQEYQREIEVKNVNTLQSYEITVIPFDISVDPDSHNVSFFPEESKQNELRSLASWVVFDENESFSVSPGEVQTISYHLEIPETVRAGDYYAAFNVYFDLIGNQERVNGGVEVRQSIGSLLLVTLSKNGEVEGVSFQDLVFSELTLEQTADEVVVNLNVLNNLLNYLNVEPMIEITDRSGETFFKQQGLAKRIFPGESTEVVHSFPVSYAQSQQPLVMNYALLAKAQNEKLYESRVEIGAPVPFLTRVTEIKYVLIVSIGIIVLILTGVTYRRKKRKKKA